jgi:hypothetical protein
MAATVPNAPTGVFAVAGKTNASIRWSAPSNNGGSAISSYTVTSSPGGRTMVPSPATNTFVLFTGLTNGTAYTFTVTATNSVGTSTASTASNSVTPSSALRFYYDSLMPTSYPGSGTTWTNIAEPANNALTLTNTTFNDGIVFNGTNSAADKTGTIISGFPATFTTILWVNRSSAKTTEQQLLSLGRKPTYNIKYFSITTTTVQDWDNSILSGSTAAITGGISANIVTQFAFTKNGTNWVMYKNGGLLQSRTATNITYPQSDLAFGYNPSTGRYLNGTIFAIKIFSSALSAAEITTEYNAGLTPSNPTNAVVTLSDSTASLSWSAPTFKGFGQSPSYLIYKNGSLAETITNGATTTTIAYTTGDAFSITASNGVSYTSASVSFALLSISAPGAPTIGDATAGNAQASVSFTAPASNGGATITSYTVTSSPGGITTTGGSSPITITGLTNGTAYTFTVAAINSAGTGAASAASASVTPRTVPGAPTNVSAVAGNGQATVSFDAPLSDGGAAISGYTVTSSPGGVTASGGPSSIVVPGLTNGTTYTFTVVATNSEGNGSASDPSIGVKPATVPGAPTNVSAVAGNGQATVSFDAPLSDGGAAVSGYTVTSSPGGVTASGGPSSIIVTGLTNGTTYTFTVVATNSEGNSASSDPSSGVTPVQGSGSAADPYVTTVYGDTYKLPPMNAPIRFYQGEVDGILLTVNATLRIQSDEEMEEENIRSFKNLAGNMTKEQSDAFLSSMLSAKEGLCFFEKVYVEYGENKLTMDMWSNKFKVESKSGSFKSSLVSAPDLLELSTKVYKKYKETTLKLNVGSAAVYLSIYPCAIIRNGIFVDAPNMKEGNGIVVNTLSSKDMTLSSLTSVSAVPKRDATKHRIVREQFTDKDGTRVKTCKVYA